MVRLVRSVCRLHLAFFLILGLALQFAIPASVLASGQPQFVQQNSATTIGTSVSATFPSSVTAGDTIIVAVSGANYPAPPNTMPTLVTDSVGNTYVKAVDYPFIPSAGSSLGIWYAVNMIGGPNTVTVRFSLYGTLAIAIHEYSGFGSAVTAYQLAAASGTSGTATTCRPFGASQSDELLIAAVTIDNHDVMITTVSPGSGYLRRALQPISNAAAQAIVSQDEGAVSALSPGYYPTSMGLTLQVTGTPTPQPSLIPSWHLVAVGFGTTVSPANTPLPTPTGSPVPGCVTAPVSELFLPMVTNVASLAGW
jgi:hypothetical protein